MNTRPPHRAQGPNDRSMPGITPPAGARSRPDTAANHGRKALHDTTARRASAPMQAQGATSMDYQQGFFSGPSS